MLETHSPAPLVIIVDADDGLRDALRFSLELEGYRVELCDSAEALLAEAIPSGRVCLVLDQHLPGISGLAALEALRSRDAAPPAVLLASQPRNVLRTAAEAAGVALVEKPLLSGALLHAIERALAG
jgi:FixJ family two-component response regulator